MKNRAWILVLVLTLAVCIGNTQLFGTRTALLENDVTPKEDSPLVSIEDGEVPQSETPSEGTGSDWTAGLEQTQVDAVNEVLRLVNEARTNAGVPALELDSTLCQAAQVRAGECVTNFSHTRPDGSSYKTAITNAGITSRYTGENAATGHSTASQVVERWLQSEGHRANILNERFTKIGIGLEKNNGRPYSGYAWTQLFIA